MGFVPTNRLMRNGLMAERDYTHLGIKLEYDQTKAWFDRLDVSDLSDAQAVVDHLRAWADDERRLRLLPPMLYRQVDSLRPRARGQQPLPPIFLAAVAHQWTATERPREKTLAIRYGFMDK